MTRSESPIGVLVASFLVFAGYATFVVLVPPDRYDCTAHNSPIYEPARLAVVAAWLAVACLLHARALWRWSWRFFAVGGFIGGGFLLIAFPELWIGSHAHVDAMHWTRVLGGALAYTVISALFSAPRSSYLAALPTGGVVFAVQLLVDSLVQMPWFCVY